MVRVTFRSTRVSGRRCGSYWSRGRSYDRTTGVVLRGTRKFVDSPLEGDGFELSVPLGGGGSNDAVSGLERFSWFKTSKRPEQDRRGYGDQAAIRQRVGEGRSRSARGTESLQTCMGLFLSSSHFWLFSDSLFGAGMPFFVPSPAIRFAERA